MPVGLLSFAASPVAPFNGKLVQTNLIAPPGNGSYPFLNLLKASAGWTFRGSPTVPLLPTDLDSDGYLINNSAGAGQGISTTFEMPSQQEKPGNYVLRWTGNGVVNTSNMTVTAYSIQITGVSQSGGKQTYQLASSPTLLRAGMPIAISGLSGGTWAGANATVAIESLDNSLNTITINTGTTFTGTVTVSGAAKAQCVATTTVSNGSGLAGVGRYVFLPSGGGGGGGQTGQMAIISVQSSSDYPRAIAFVHQDDEASLDRGGIFQSTFLAVCANFGVLRDLGWRYGPGNLCTESTWSTRKPISYVAYGGSQLRSDLYSGAATQSVSASGATYAVSYPSGFSSLTDKATVMFTTDKNSFASITALASDGGSNTIVTFDNTGVNTSFAEGESVAIASISNGSGTGWTGCNGTFPIVGGSVTATTFKIAVNSSAFTGTPTLTSATVRHTAVLINVGASGAKAARTVRLNTLIGSASSPTMIGGGTGCHCTAVYDLGLDSWICAGAQGTGSSSGIANYVPPELVFELCLKVGAHPYLVSPMYTLDNPTDYMPNLMLLAKQYQARASWMIPRFEGPNELWNNTFAQTAYATTKSNQSGRAWNNLNEWYGMAISLLGQMATAVYGTRPGAATNYQVLAGIQTGSAATLSGIPTARLESTAFVAGGVAPPSITVAGVGTINFSAARAAPTTAQGGSTATNYVSHLAWAQYWNLNLEKSNGGYPSTETSLGSALAPCRFTATINAGAGTMTVTAATFGTIVFDGSMTLKGTGVPSGVTITGQSSGTAGGVGVYTLSSSSFNDGYAQVYYGAVDLTTPATYLSSGYDAVFNGTVVGNQLTVNSLTSGFLPFNTVASTIFVKIYGGAIGFNASGATITGGTYPTFTLSGSPGNQSNVDMRAGVFSSIDGLQQVNTNAVQFALNHNVMKGCGYEGGYSPDYQSSGNSNGDQLRYQAKFVAAIQTMTTQVWNDFLGRNNGGWASGFVAEYPSQFLATGFYPSTDTWGVLEDIFVMPRPPMWNAIANYT